MRKMFSEKQIKEMISEGSQEKATEVIESGLVDNAKPIYCHALYWAVLNENETIRTSCLIFNNDETLFTTESFIDYIFALYEQVQSRISIMASGGKRIGEGAYAPLVRIITNDGEHIAFNGAGTTNASHSKEDLITNTSDFMDGCNKIN